MRLTYRVLFFISVVLIDPSTPDFKSLCNFTIAEKDSKEQNEKT